MLTLTKEAEDQPSTRTFVARATRYEPHRNDSCLAWGAAGQSDVPRADADPEFALLLDISLTGASVATDRLPQPGEDAWLKVGAGRCEGWNHAAVVGVTRTPHGPHLVRLAFDAPCPEEILVATICG